MRDMLLDIWTDLREKRLWPVAVALVLGLLAVPLGLGGGSGEEPAPGALTQQPSRQRTGPVVETADRDAPASDLNAFDSKDPFKPGAEPPSSRSGTGTVTAPAGPTGASDGSGASGGGAVSSAARAGGAPGIDGASPSGATASPPAATPPGRPRVKRFSYVVDLSFGRTGRERRRRGVKRMTILPDDKHPLLVFLGVTADRKQAVFLADSTASQSGEGKCRPDVDSCTFIYLSTSEERDQHFIADAEGREYGLQLLGIRAVEIKRKSRSSRSARRERRPAPDSRRRGDAEATPFRLPVLLDGLTR